MLHRVPGYSSTLSLVAQAGEAAGDLRGTKGPLVRDKRPGRGSRVVAVLLVGVGLAGCATTAEAPRVEVSLPPGARIMPPAATVPKDVAAFSGKWVGVWVGPGPQEGLGRLGAPRRREHMLVVEEVRARDATVIYAWGSGAGLATPDPRPGWVRLTGEFVDGTLRLMLPGLGATVTYRMRPDGTLDATHEGGGYIRRARMTRPAE